MPANNDSKGNIWSFKSKQLQTGMVNFMTWGKEEVEGAEVGLRLQGGRDFTVNALFFSPSC